MRFFAKRACSWPVSLVLFAAFSCILGAGEAGKQEPDDPARAAREAPEAKFQQRVTMEFHDVTVAEAAQQLAKLVGCTILVDPALPGKGTQFSLPKMTISAQHWLQWICRYVGATYVVRYGAIIITERPAGGPGTRIYDISDLVRVTVRNGRESLQRCDSLGEAYTRLIRSAIAPGTWLLPEARREFWGEGPCIVAYSGGRLLVRHTEAVQNQVTALLDGLREIRRIWMRGLRRPPADEPEWI